MNLDALLSQHGLWIGVLLGYLLGSVPFGLLIARAKGIDIRAHGSGNIGATNVLRVLGKPLGITTFILDALKGFLPAFAFPLVFGNNPELVGIASGIAAILGHNFPVFLRFKGGKGVATSAGMLIGIAPAAAGIGLALWLVIFLAFRYVSLASILAALAIAGIAWLWYPPGLIPPVLSLLASLVIIRHRANIQRLLNGTENRFERKPKAQPS
ncbi:MAG TPA: glycerol-3-phosphate 1-O-acyltransferase PlsY [Kiritimatiellia bacterium]|nr:glycerol-3-phosphate 1-O-acyltransferase PlsY [Kiritimatiellia bacterium]